MKKTRACMMTMLCACAAMAPGLMAEAGSPAGAAGESELRDQQELLRLVAPNAASDPAMGLKASKARVSALMLSQGEREWVEVEDGIRYQDVHVGNGNPLVRGAMAFMKWDMFDGEGWGIDIKSEPGTTTSRFVYDVADTDMLGSETVLRSFEKGIATMREGGRRLVWVRSDKGYGKDGSADPYVSVPPATDLYFEASLMWVRKVDPRRYAESEPTSRVLTVSEQEHGTDATVAEQ